jgi:hypothetical protein
MLIPCIVLAGVLWAVTTLSLQYQLLFLSLPDQIVFDINFASDAVFHLLCLVFGCAIISKSVFLYRIKHDKIADTAARKSFDYVSDLLVCLIFIDLQDEYFVNWYYHRSSIDYVY